MADHPAVGRFAAGQLPLRGRQLRAAELEPGFRLGDVGAGQIADLEAVAGRLEVGLAAPSRCSGSIRRSRGRGSRPCRPMTASVKTSPSTARTVARPASTRVSAARIVVTGRAAVEQRVADVDSGRDSCGPCRRFRATPLRVRSRLSADGRADLGPAGGLGDRDVGVGRREGLALGRQSRVGLIGGHQRLAQRVGGRRAGHQRSHQRPGNNLPKHVRRILDSRK